MNVTRMALGVCLLAVLSAGTGRGQDADVKGGKDQPLLSRYPGAVIKEYQVFAFDELTLPLGKLKGGKPEKSQKLEGKITRIHYVAPVGRTVLEIYRNYESALKGGGFGVLFTCANNDGCGGDSVLLN